MELISTEPLTLGLDEKCLGLDEKWILIYKKINEGTEADKKEVAVEILRRIEGHLETSRRKYVGKFDGLQPINLSDATNFNATLEAINTVRKLYFEARKDFVDYKNKYLPRFKPLRELRTISMCDPTYG